jgi:hypothetical protein
MIKGTARSTGLLYLVMGLPAPISLMYMPRRFFVPGDATATAANIAGGELVYRFGVLAGLISSVGFLLLALSLYRLLRDVDRLQARLLLSLVLMASVLGLVDSILLLAPLVFIHGAAAMPSFTQGQLDALALGFLRIRGAEIGIAASLWGLWLLPFGILVIRSRFIPAFIGVLLIIGGFAYLVGSVTSILFPEHLDQVSKITLPLGAPGELSIMLWLLIRGGRVPMPQPAPV